MKFKFWRLLRAAVLCFGCLASTAFADDALPYNVATLSWLAPMLNSDGTPLTDLQGYMVYAGNSPDNLLPYYYCSGYMQSITMIYPLGVTRYFAVSAVNVEGEESDLTPVVSKPL